MYETNFFSDKNSTHNRGVGGNQHMGGQSVNTKFAIDNHVMLDFVYLLISPPKIWLVNKIPILPT